MSGLLLLNFCELGKEVLGSHVILNVSVVHVLELLDEVVLVLDDVLDCKAAYKPVRLKPFLKILTFVLVSLVILPQVLKQLCHSATDLLVVGA